MTIMHSQADRENAALDRELGYPFYGPTDESFSDFVQMKVIARKRAEQYGNNYGANGLPMIFAQYKDLLRNVCVRVDPLRMADLDALTEVLDCNKQEFVLEALVAGIEQAKAALRAAGLERSFDEVVDRNLVDAGFTVAPKNESGYWGLHYRGELIVNKDAKHHEKMAKGISGTIGEALPEDQG